MKPILLSFLFIAFLFTVEAQTPNRAAPDIISTGKGPLTIQPLVHASLVLSISGLTIYADPTGGAANYTGIKTPNLILITDIHGDHFDPKTISAVRTAGTTLVVPKAVADLLPDSLKGKIVILNNGDKTTLSGISIAALPMYNLPENPKAMHTKGRGNGYILGIGGKNLYLSGDTQGIPEMRSLKNIDIAFVCMNLPYTMNINEAADAVLAFKPKIVYPYHYRGQGGLSDVEGFKKLVEAGNKNIEVRLRNWYPSK
ncbi:MAG TPA: MBL fold metallo-hydrolase [Puia sp.]|jgi:L-ascorbate metabolism protein UlaG (beta-lactamase superfamily)